MKKLTMDDYYGEDLDYIHLKWGDMRKCYNFTEKFRAKHPNFCKEYEKYWVRDKTCKFEDPMQIVNYVEYWGVPIHFYFNFTDTPAKDTRDVKEYLIRERIPHDYGEFVDNEYVGWDGEKEAPHHRTAVIDISKIAKKMKFSKEDIEQSRLIGWSSTLLDILEKEYGVETLVKQVIVNHKEN